MSFHYTNIINQNLAMYSQLKKTEPCAEKFQCETNCLTDIFRFNKIRTYTCKTITHMYVLRFMNRYASEIYHIFSDLIPPLNNGDLILSLGCGPCFETVGLDKYCRDKNIGKIQYMGIDSNTIWQDVANSSCCLSTQNIESRFKYTNTANLSTVLPITKVFLLNYCLSDIKNHSNLHNFLCNDFTAYLNLLPNNSYIIINDQNHGFEWEDIFDQWAQNLNPNNYEVCNYFFDPYPKACNPRGIRMKNKQLVFSNTDLDSSITSYFQEHLLCCESGISIIHKL